MTQAGNKEQAIQDVQRSSKNPKRDATASGQSQRPTSRTEQAKSSSSSDETDHTRQYIDDYAGYLAPVILFPAQQTGRSPILIAIALGIIAMVLHLSLPIFITPHFSCLWTMVLPLQSTVRALRAELYPPPAARSKKASPKKPKDSEDEEAAETYKEEQEYWTKMEEKRKADEKRYSNAKRHKAAAAQWLLFWLLYTAGSLGRGYVGILRPGWRGWFEVCRTVALTAAGGPWFSPSALE